jgi:ankyrin repeat protein
MYLPIFKSQKGWTGLVYASFQGFIETMSVLLAAKADPNIIDEVNSGSTTATVCTIVKLMHYVTGW